MVNLTCEISELAIVEIPEDIEILWDKETEEVFLVDNSGDLLSREASDSEEGKLGAYVVAVELLRELLDSGYIYQGEKL